MLSGIPTATLMDWCKLGDFQERLTMTSVAIHPFAGVPDGNGVVFSKQACALIDRSDNVSAILNNFVEFIPPPIVWGDQAEVIATRRRPFEALLQHNRAEVREAAQILVARLQESESKPRQKESDFLQRFE